MQIDGEMVPAEAMIAEAHLETYRQEHETIYHQLITIKNNLFVFEKIITFPYELFAHSTSTVFWTLASKAFYDSTVIALDTMLAEKGQRFALPEFRRKLEKYLRKDIDSHLKAELQKQIDEADFDNQISEVRAKLKSVRDHHVAHLDYDTKIRRDKTVQYVIALNELQQAAEIAHKSFVVLSFDTYPSLDLVDYVVTADKSRTDIDDLLTFVASRSTKIFRFGTPSQKERSRARVEKLPDEQKQIVGYWQQRVDKLFGKDET